MDMRYIKELAPSMIIDHLGNGNLGAYVKGNYYNLIKYDAVVMTFDAKGDMTTLKVGFVDITRNFKALQEIASISPNPVYIMNKSTIALPPEQVEEDFFVKITKEGYILGKSLELNLFVTNEDGAPVYKKEEIKLENYVEFGYVNLKRIMELNPQHAPWKLFGSVLGSSGLVKDMKAKDILYSPGTHKLLMESSATFFNKTADKQEEELIKNLEDYLPSTSDAVKDGFLYVKKGL